MRCVRSRSPTVWRARRDSSRSSKLVLRRGECENSWRGPISIDTAWVMERRSMPPRCWRRTSPTLRCMKPWTKRALSRPLCPRAGSPRRAWRVQSTGPRLGRARSKNVQSQPRTIEDVRPASRRYSAPFEDDRNTPSRPFKAVARVQIPVGHYCPLIRTRAREKSLEPP